MQCVIINHPFKQEAIALNSILDDAYKLGCGRLFFEHGALKRIGEEALRLGTRAYVIGGPNAMAHVQEALLSSLKESGIETVCDVYAGPCSEEKAQEIAEICRRHSLNLLIGTGGGRIMDLIKIASDVTGLPVITVPTISATCASFTPLSVVYTPEGACLGTWYFRREVDCLICDLDILCEQSPRHLAAGMLDAIAKHVEVSHHAMLQSEAGQDVLLARLLAHTIYNDLMMLGEKALRKEAEALERCIFHAIITTGMVSSIARGRYQSAVAHALYEAIRTCYTVESRPFLHGEVVAVGLLIQARYLKREDMTEDLLRLMKAANMPLTLRAIGVTGDPTELAVHDPVPCYYLHENDAQTLMEVIQNC